MILTKILIAIRDNDDAGALALIPILKNLNQHISNASPLASATVCNREYIIKQLLLYGANPNYSPRIVNPMLPLHIAISQNMYNIANILINNGANVNIMFNDMPLIWWFIDNDRYDNVKYLIDNKAELNTIVANHTLLTKATIYNKIEYVRLLIEHGASIHTYESYMSPLYYAILHNHIDLVNLYIRLNADICICDNDVLTIEAKTLEILVDNLDSKTNARILNTIISEMDNCEYLDDKIHILINSNININDLFDAYIYIDYKTDIVLDILKRGVTMTNRRFLLLMWSPINIIQYALDNMYNIDINTRDKYGANPLIMHCIGSNPNIYTIELLIKNGAKTNLPSAYGRDILEVLYRQRKYNIVHELIKKGYDDTILKKYIASNLVAYYKNKII